MLRTFRFIIASSLLIGWASVASAVTPSESDAAAVDTTAVAAVFQRLYVELDVAPLVESVLINKYAYTLQGNLMAMLSERFFPLIEMGFSGAQRENRNGSSFGTAGLFGKLGVDFRLLKPDAEATIKTNNLLGGVRFGMSKFNYSIHNMVVEDGYWKGTEVINQDRISATKYWIEFVAGIRVAVHKNIYMGWNVRHKLLLNAAREGETAPWYIPGYGLGHSSVWAFSYVLAFGINTSGK